MTSMRLILTAAVAALVLAACGSDEAPRVADGRPASFDTALALGERAESPFVDYGSKHLSKSRVGVRVLRVRRGTMADFEGFDLNRKQRRSVPYYIDATYENLGKFALTRHLLRASVQDQDGREIRPANLVVLNGDFAPCREYSDASLKPGARFTGCSPILVPRGSKLDRVRFQGDVMEKAVYWQPR